MRSPPFGPPGTNGAAASGSSADAEIDFVGEAYDVAAREARAAGRPLPAIEEYLPRVGEACRPGLRDHLERLRKELEAEGPPPEARVGQRLGDYQLVAFLGAGGQGSVYGARSAHAPQVVALKIVHPAQRARAVRELEIACQLDHENLVRVHHVGEQAGRLYFTMPLAAVSLEERLGDYHLKPPPATPFLPEAVRGRRKKIAVLLAKVAHAVHHLHERAGVVHRDLKPRNILLDQRGEPLVIDLGLACRIGPPTGDPGPDTISEVVAGGAAGRTRAGGRVGTVGYMSPEQASGQGHVTAASDIYSLGVVLFRLLTAAMPFHGTDAEVIDRTADLAVPAPPPSSGAAASDLERICQKCLAKRPEERYADARALALDLERFAREEETSVRRQSWAERVLRTAVTAVNHKLPLAGIRRWGAIDLWDAGLNLAANAAIYALVRADQPPALLWLVLLTFSVVWWWMFLTYLFRRNPIAPAERNLALLWAGVTLAHVTLFWVYCPPLGAARAHDLLAYYPPWAVVNGLAFLVVGRLYWGRYYVLGLAHFVLAALMPLRLDLAPLVYGGFVALCMAYGAAEHFRVAHRERADGAAGPER